LFFSTNERGRLASEADSKAEGSGYPHLDLIIDIVRRLKAR
jgi:hypothetical protein